MLDIALIRRDPERIRRALVRRGLDASVVDEILRYDGEYRCALRETEARQAEKNRLSASIARAEDKPAAAREARPKIDELSREIEAFAERARALEPSAAQSPLRALVEQLPNLVDETVPDGADPSDNVEVRRWGAPPAFGFTPKPHWELGERLGILDFERAAKLSGSRFTLLRGDGARLARSLTAFFLDRAQRRGYVEVAPPLLVSRTTMWSTGQLSKFADAMFEDAQAGLFMIPTAEVPLVALHADEILEGAELPHKYCAATPCFRKEAGAAGKDTRGLLRQHQFDKVELAWFCDPEQSSAALELLTRDAESLLEELELPYRVVLLCAGDTGFNAAKTYDLEVWVPSGDSYREVSSCSNCTDFQARRAGIRFRPERGAKAELVHTLNGSGLAVGRTLLAILENRQRADGSIAIPQALQPYFGAARIPTPKM
ncbi:MAG: serine--tRNA ligase [Candidatus Eremiobacteraeota bacterium]|nr:serine--tRNA ligase [Candidatus Eremiobacteraeota bacterium]MBV9056303.1 serine--tRNA ligase [Candidatus Eremiobacteraeota bacterium]